MVVFFPFLMGKFCSFFRYQWERHAPRRLGLLSLLLSSFLSPVFVDNTFAKDLGVWGETFLIQEPDALQLIEEKLQHLHVNGELLLHQEKLKEKAYRALISPKPVLGISHTQTERSFTYDPSLTLKDDLKDHLGNVFAKKGTVLNPLKYLNWTHVFLMIDGEKEEQIKWVKEHIQQGVLTKVILIKGSPLKVEKELGVPVYFDQFGVLSKKFGLKQVPALIYQEGLFLQVREVLPTTKIQLKEKRGRA